MRIYYFFALLFFLVLFFAGCENNKPFTEEQAIIFVDNVSLMALEHEDIEILEKKIDEGIHRLDQDRASEVVNALLYAMHQRMPDFNAKISGLQEIIADHELKNVNAFGSDKDIDQIKDITLKAFLQEIQNSHFKIKNEAGFYVANPDMEYVLNKYKTYMKDDLKAWVEFLSKEYQQSIFDEIKQQFDLDVIANRIIELEGYISQFPDSNFASGFARSRAYYYQIYFGINHEYMVDPDHIVLDEVLKHYRKTIQENPNSQLSKDLTAYLKKLEEEENQLNDNVYAFLSNLTEADIMEGIAQSVEGVNRIREAIKEALQKNNEKE